jgi:hypothetical protein
MKEQPHNITIGARFHHIDCEYNMEVVDIKRDKSGNMSVEVKYLDRDRPNFNAPLQYIQSMFSYKRFILND